MNGDTTRTRNGDRSGESIRRIITLEYHRTGLCQYGGMRINHRLQTVDTGIDRCLLNDGSPADDRAGLTDTLDIHLRASDNHLTTVFQVTAPIHVTDDDLRSREHDAMLIIYILAIVQTLEDIGLHLLNGLFLLVNLSEILLYTILEVTQDLLPIVKYIIHSRSPF